MIDIDLNAFAVPSNDIEWFQQHKSMFRGFDDREIVAVDPILPVFPAVDDEEKEASNVAVEAKRNSGRMKLINELIMKNDRLIQRNQQLREQNASFQGKVDHHQIVISEAVEVINELTQEAARMRQQSLDQSKNIFLNCYA